MNNNYMYPFLVGKNCIVTGCNRGIGKKILSTLAENGVNIWACTRHKTEEYLFFISSLEDRYGIRINPIYLDLSDENSIKKAVKEIYSEKKSVDFLVNNAGIVHHGLFTMTSISEMKRIYDVNVFGPSILMQNVLRIMQRQKYGNIVNMCSIAALDSHQGDSIYGSSKAALASITKVSAAESAQYGIRINAVAPGPVDTDMINEGFSSMKETVFKNSAMQRLASTDEIADTVLFLLSDKSSFINGQIIRIDGGTL